MANPWIMVQAFSLEADRARQVFDIDYQRTPIFCGQTTMGKVSRLAISIAKGTDDWPPIVWCRPSFLIQSLLRRVHGWHVIGNSGNPRSQNKLAIRMAIGVPVEASWKRAVADMFIETRRRSWKSLLQIYRPTIWLENWVDQGVLVLKPHSTLNTAIHFDVVVLLLLQSDSSRLQSHQLVSACELRLRTIRNAYTSDVALQCYSKRTSVPFQVSDYDILRCVGKYWLILYDKICLHSYDAACDLDIREEHWRWVQHGELFRIAWTVTELLRLLRGILRRWILKLSETTPEDQISFSHE